MVPIVIILGAVAIPSFLKARREGNEKAAIGALRDIAKVQPQFREGQVDGGVLQPRWASSLGELAEAGLIDHELASGTKRGYAYSLTGTADAWQATATPVSSGMGTRNFIVCTDGIVRWASGEEQAGCDSAPVDEEE